VSLTAAAAAGGVGSQGQESCVLRERVWCPAGNGKTGRWRRAYNSGHCPSEPEPSMSQADRVLSLAAVLILSVAASAHGLCHAPVVGYFFNAAPPRYTAVLVCPPPLMRAPPARPCPPAFPAAPGPTPPLAPDANRLTPPTARPDYAPPTPAPPSAGPVTSFSSAPSALPDRPYYDAYPVAGSSHSPSAPSARLGVEFWNLTGQPLRLKIEGRSHSLAAGTRLHEEVGRQFVWQVEGRDPQRENVTVAESGLDIVIRR
jgi:hypothetical protein